MDASIQSCSSFFLNKKMSNLDTYARIGGEHIRIPTNVCKYIDHTPYEHIRQTELKDLKIGELTV
jgi:hypothetical protein